MNACSPAKFKMSKQTRFKAAWYFALLLVSLTGVLYWRETDYTNRSLLSCLLAAGGTLGACACLTLSSSGKAVLTRWVESLAVLVVMILVSICIPGMDEPPLKPLWFVGHVTSLGFLLGFAINAMIIEG